MSYTLQMFHKLCVPDLCTYPNLNEPEKNYKKAILFVVLKRFIYERAKNTNANSKRQKAAAGFPTTGQAVEKQNTDNGQCRHKLIFPNSLSLAWRLMLSFCSLSTAKMSPNA